MVLAIVSFAAETQRVQGGPHREDEGITAQFISDTGVSWETLAAGSSGRGTALYYRADRGRLRPTLAVRLTTDSRTRRAIAEVFDAPHDMTWVPVAGTNRSVNLREGLKPAVIVRALGGWWVRNGLPNYNLDIQVYGRVDAMWGSEAYHTLLPADGLTYHIQTRTDGTGIPRWDYRALLPQLPGHGVIRTNYAERRCGGPFQFGPSVSPFWPYVGFSGGFEQPSGTVRPPILVDRTASTVRIISEIVTVRNQNCSYDLYSLVPLDPGALVDPDFESPWGLYDLSGAGRGYPNLVIRTEHYYAGDPWTSLINPSAFAGAPVPHRSNEVVRYSWALHPGNQHFDFKVDVFGFHTFIKPVELADGTLHVRVPSYSDYPRWVIGRRWPSMTFVDTDGGGYATSEGIYDWTSIDIGTRYWNGWEDRPDLRQFRHIAPDLRGEYSVGRKQRPLLYSSTVDGRLHLIHAQGGLWNLGHGWQLREQNLEGGADIDTWQLIRNNASVPPGRTSLLQLPVVAELSALPPYLLYRDAHGVTIRHTTYSPEAFRVLPPVDRGSWERFKALQSRLEKRNPRDPHSWLAAFPGDNLQITRGTISNLRATLRGFSLLLTVPQAVDVRGSMHGLTLPLQPGAYILTYDRAADRWTVARGTPPNLRTVVHPLPHLKALYPTTVRIILRNTGTEDWRGQVALMVDGTVRGSTTVTIPGQQKHSLLLPWTPFSAGRVSMAVRAGSVLLWKDTLPVVATTRPDLATLARLSLPVSWVLPESLGLVFVLLAGFFTLWKRTWKTL